VKQDLELKDVTSNFYLRDGSQLLQGTTNSGSNKGWVIYEKRTKTPTTFFVTVGDTTI
jgi:hypothetical protein